MHDKKPIKKTQMNRIFQMRFNQRYSEQQKHLNSLNKGHHISYAKKRLTDTLDRIISKRQENSIKEKIRSLIDPQSSCNVIAEKEPKISGVIESIPRHDLTKGFKKLFQIRNRNLLTNEDCLGQNSKNLTGDNSMMPGRLSSILPPLHQYEGKYKSKMIDSYLS